MNDEPHTHIRETTAEIRERQCRATREARMTWTSWPEEVWERPWVGFVLSAAIPGVLLSLLGPFGSYAAPLWMRLAYWMPTMALGATVGAALTIWTDRAAVFEGRPVLRIAAMTTAMTAAMAGLAWGMAQLVFGPGSVAFTPEFVFYVWVITMIVSVISAIIRARRVAIAAAPVPGAAVGQPRLSARLPVKLQDAAILALESEDHYVRVHTSAGSELILMRLGDAIAEMGHAPGARAHRSWWVAKTAVESLKRNNGRLALLLAGGLEVPVSRGYASELREAGWFDGKGRAT
jgi:LytTr DNA-binding domain